MHFFERFWCEHGFFALVAHNLICQTQLFQRPEDAMGTRLVKVVDR
ncbi:Uncharacterised protein [Enterobacter cloacae]|nr:Uncharacterised protein [Enterobacter cloacae]